MIDDSVLVHDWHAVARSSEIGSGEVRQARLLEHDVVLWRDSAHLHAWQDLCPHRGAQLSGGKVQRDRLVCPYHGWQYDTSGGCVCIPAHPGQPPPARAKATVYRVTEKYGLAWVSLGDLAHEIAPFPEWENPSFRKVAAGPYRFRAHGSPRD